MVITRVLLLLLLLAPPPRELLQFQLESVEFNNYNEIGH
jgi:hypothetical protein